MWEAAASTGSVPAAKLGGSPNPEEMHSGERLLPASPHAVGTVPLPSPATLAPPAAAALRGVQGAEYSVAGSSHSREAPGKGKKTLQLCVTATMRAARQPRAEFGVCTHMGPFSPPQLRHQPCPPWACALGRGVLWHMGCSAVKSTA